MTMPLPAGVQAAAPIGCDSCAACCCRLEVLLADGDDPPAHLVTVDSWGGEVMRRLDDGWCVAVDRDTMRCRIYTRRPGVCRDYPAGGSDCRVERRRAGVDPDGVDPDDRSEFPRD